MIYSSEKGFRGMSNTDDMWSWDLDEPATFLLILDDCLLYVRSISKSKNEFAFSFKGAIHKDGQPKKEVCGVLSTSQDQDVKKRTWVQVIVL